jgi:hypothetical protein
MKIVSLIVALLFQAPAPVSKVVVGLINGQQVVVEDPEFTGFIHGRSLDSVLFYRHQPVHGVMPTRTIARIDFGEYKKGQPVTLMLTLRNGQKLEVQTERNQFLMLRGNTELGTVIIKHPDPLSGPTRLTTNKPDRKDDLTIQYLEFPAS